MYHLIRNHANSAIAIARNDRYILHLDAGTVRNTENAQRVVDVLNAAEAVLDHTDWVGMCDEDTEFENAIERLRELLP